MRQKGFAPIIFLIVIFVLGVIGYFGYTKGYINIYPSKSTPTIKPQQDYVSSVAPTAQSETDTTEGWITYTSIQNYQINYPAGWLINEQMVTEFYSKDKKITVSIFRNSDVNFDSMESKKNIYEAKPDEFKIVKDLNIDGKPAFMFDFLKTTEREVVLAGDLDKVPGTIFTIFITYVPESKTEALEIFDQMLSTFKFI